MRPAIRGASSAISSIPRRQVPLTFRSRPTYHQTLPTPSSIQALSSTAVRFEESSAEKSARKLNEKSLAEHEDGYKGSLDNVIGQQKEMQQKEMQQRTPWHREGSDMPPVKRMRSASAMTKGKLLTTPSRLLKLILPLTTLDKNSDRKDIEPLALLVHPHQPLSYLERLIQSELPMIESSDGKHKSPQVHFRAEQSSADEIEADKKAADLEDEDGEVVKDEEGSEAQMIDGKLVKLGKINEKKAEAEGGGKIQSKKARLEESLRGGPGEGGVESYSGAGREGSSNGEKHFVRWSSSTEIGDFIRDAARGSEFAVEIEGAENEIRVGVPSFNDRTHYLRVRLRKTSKKLANYASIKKECDRLAHKSAQRLAIGGFGVLMGWWCAIYYFTFMTDYGWDLMEPVTYLAGLSTIMLGYLWFLYHNREVSYRAALNLTVSRRQNTLYQEKGFDVGKWEQLIEEANALRKEVKAIAEEYDVEWDERKDEGSEAVHKALKEEREKKEGKGREDDDEDKKNDEERKKGTGKGEEVGKGGD